MSLSCHEITNALTELRKLDPEGLCALNAEPGILTLIESVNQHNILLASTIREISLRLPGALSPRTLAELQTMLARRIGR